MEKARRPSRGLGHLPVWLHSPKEPTVPFFPSFLFLLDPVKPSPIAEAIFPDSVGLSIRVKPCPSHARRPGDGPCPSLAGRIEGRCASGETGAYWLEAPDRSCRMGQDRCRDE